jgi:hypothetical protein
LVKAHVRGSAALMRLGSTAESIECAEAAVSTARPPTEARETRLAELRGRPVRELRDLLYSLQRAAARRAAEAVEYESGSRRNAAARRGLAPCLQPVMAPVDPSLESSPQEKPIDKSDLVTQIEGLERAAEEGGDGAVFNMATQALAEARAMRDRVDEIGVMAQRGDWLQVLEHARWLATDYPQHRALRALHLDALIGLCRLEEAHALCEEQLHVTPDAPELLHATAELLFRQHGADVALRQLREVPLADLEHARAADLNGRLVVLLDQLQEAREALLQGRDQEATEAACRALCLADGSEPARQSIYLLLARCLGKGGRHVEVVRACDAGLAAAAAAAAAAADAAIRDVHDASGAPSDHERLLLRRAASFVVLGQFAEAVADYRSAAALNPSSAQAASGLKEAWRALQTMRKRGSLYEVLGCASDASAEELRRAYRKQALLWHPDKHAHEDASKQIEADARFKELAAAWAVLSDEATRAAYDEER